MKHLAHTGLTAWVCAAALLGSSVQALAAQALSPAEREARAARFTRELTTQPEAQLRANALRRCENLPAFYKVDCEARVNGQGQISGSVAGGGLLKETTTTVPAEEMENIPGMGGLPPPAQTR
ncbi:hypothetical protein [Ramlibacter sp. 2FC]|uniref:hypothetical protein n=1 Tax=Ramlibacter sp. 2FC TaxID=2502188 RepID=UPI0010F9125A|nr:hypothetical protein [Ramlibacter sp. 2FC]